MKIVHAGELLKTYAKPPTRLGETVLDEAHNRWRLCKALSNIFPSRVIKDSILLSGTCTAASAVGSRIITDSGAFASLTNQDLVGASGSTAGALVDGGGQTFMVTRRLSDDQIEVLVEKYTSAASTSAKSLDGGFGVALTTNTTFDLHLHGRVTGATAAIAATGICHSAPIATSTPYFFAQMSGEAEVMALSTGNAILPGQIVTVSATAGLVHGPTATGAPTAAELAGQVGVALGQVVAFNSLVLVRLTFPDVPRSYRVPKIDHPFNEVNI